MSSKRAQFIERKQKRRAEATARQERRAKRTPTQQIEATTRRGANMGLRELKRLVKEQPSLAASLPADLLARIGVI